MADERTEEATPKKLRDARRRGDVWRSRELGVAIGLLAGAAVLGATGSAILEALVASFTLALDAAAGRLDAGPGAILEAALATAAGALAPLLIVVIVSGTLAALAQIGPLFAPDVVAWKLERLDPIAGARKLLSTRSAIELVKIALLLAIVTSVVLATLREGWRGVASLVARDAHAALSAGGSLVEALLLRTGAAVLAVALLDVVYQRWRWLRDHRMSQREIEREHRESDGDPHLQHERERVRRELAMASDLDAVASATVVIVGAGVAVALAFDRTREDAVPEVVARGRGELVARLVQVAHASEIPVRTEPALARALVTISRGEPIPARHYEAVAQLLHAVWSAPLPPPASRRTSAP
ncbi:EscU/YscU/HrcU family type III secretion system export apparatus switch protein [Sandaracinus amylolyticus]|uniref:Flagellar biosynthesis protein FlhB n=1 Tax=Sandaracinus amylolyticus TaxID=927083 RepID=A0A0F6YGC4_9BACT|nr:EscU/YscU/HrcU family type III secretion system export apparatus switch protein [Sandaracinus amylolyticus]AKF04532.1 Flagellar biosynthesis protein FlhB [Sandaracinus amylolyticus]